MPRPLLTGLAATAIAACAMALSGLALPGNAAAGTRAAQQLGGASLISVAITSMNPVYAQPGKTVTVTGTVTNTSSNPVSGVSVQLRSSSTPFDNRSELQQYADGNITGDDSLVGGAISELSGTLNPHATQTWSIPLNPDEVPISGTFGVYPLAAEAYNPDFTAVAVSRTFLPFWPGNSAQDLATQQIAWIWPLIDQPRQAQCPGLLDNGLASSVASGGRLAGLLAAGSQYASSAHLTWAVDPALLASLTTMTSSYQVHSGAGCEGGTKHSASQAAAAWLTQLKTATTGQPVFATPYDDADIAALTSGNMNSDLNRAFTAGRTAAGRILGRSFAPTGGAGASMNGTAWPADGIANYAVLENLAASDGINTVVLDSSTMPPTTAQYFTPSAQTTTPDGEGPDLNVLLSDDTITQVLDSANSPSDSKATAFSAAQRYLAETAMITAEAPDLSRSIVVAPPRRWDPPAGLASELMSETVSAPWLRPTSLGQLATAKSPSGEVSRQAPTATSSAQLPSSLLTQASQLDQQAALLESVQATPDTGYNDALNSAVMAVESSAWRGGGSALAAGQALAQQTGMYLSGQQGKLTIIGPPRVTLGGPTGAVPVSVSNGLGFAVRVGLEAADPNGRVTAKQTHHTIVVPPGQQEVVKLQVTASGDGSATLQLNLVNPAGVPLSARRTIIVQATHYGDLALVIIASALAIFLLASAARAVRRGLRRPRAGGPGPPEPPEPPSNDDPERYGDGPGQQEADAGQRGLPDGPDGADSVMSDGGGTGQMTGQTRDDDRAEATDDYAWAPGQAERL